MKKHSLETRTTHAVAKTNHAVKEAHSYARSALSEIEEGIAWGGGISLADSNVKYAMQYLMDAMALLEKVAANRQIELER